MRIIQGILACVGRLMISIIFLLSAFGNKILNFNTVADLMAAQGMPQDDILGIPAHKYLLCGAIVFLIFGGLSVAAGFKARLGASMLLLFLAGATYYFHDFWNAEAVKKPTEMIQFLKNLALSGTMLFIIANGAGPGSLDQRKKLKSMRGDNTRGSQGMDEKKNRNLDAGSSKPFHNLQGTTPESDDHSTQLPG